MFDAHCAACGNRILVSYGRLIGLDNGPEGITVHFRCYCGAEGSFLTGWASHGGGRTSAACSP
jgi:hypothetical protein